MKTSIIIGVIFLLFIPTVYACKNPVLYTEEGSAINPFGGWLIINGTKYPDLTAQYNLEIKNDNDKGLIVTLQPSDSIKDYISGGGIYLDAKSSKNMTLNVWVGGQCKTGTIDVNFICDDEPGQYIYPFVNVELIGKKIAPPPTSSCDSSGLDGCYEGMYRSYYCSNGTLQYKDSCNSYCCKGYDSNAFCSNDKRVCISSKNLPPGTEGNIAFLCNNDKCNKKIEQQTMFLFRFLGWNVTAKAYNTWNETDLDKYDIIACTEQSRACKMDFNSIVYNQHVEKGKPILEITDSNSAKAAYYLGYINRYSGYQVREYVNVTSTDIITEGYSGPINVTTEKPKFVSISHSYLTSEVINLADGGKSGKSVFFKVDANNHGKYAFIGWLMGYVSGTLTNDGEVLLNETLKWLKESSPLTPQGKIAFICDRDDCSRESNLMKFLRANEYSVTGKGKESWTGEMLNNFDMMACSYYKACDIGKNSIFYNSSYLNGKGFIEIPDSSKIYAGYIFNHTKSNYGSLKSSSEIMFVVNNLFTNGFSNTTQVFARAKSMSGATIDKLNSVTDIAHVNYNYRTQTPISTMFNSDASGSKGRYFYLGWLGRSSIDDLTSDGKALLLRSIKWTLCGDGCL